MSEAAFQDLGEKITRSLMTGDFGLYRAQFRLPLTVVPRSAPGYVLADEAALSRDFDLYLIALRTEEITDIVRRVRALSLPRPTEMEVDCEVNILRRAERVVSPFLSRFSLTRTGTDWQVHRIESALGHIRWTLGEGRLDDI
ncbi:MAG: hypothetical protein H6899_06480 [Rhodobacter sp.]|nr:hypothetical protein [Paracoccaceae bacterium]MCC0079583.1 hypothetical protein [Rhodobacter sp.]